MSNNKQSSVEWYSNQIGKITADALSGKITGLEWSYLELKTLIQAKAMHKEEHGKTWDKSLDNLKARGMNEMRAYADFDEYYEETYESNNRI